MASPVSSGTQAEVEKLQWAQKYGADTLMDLSTGGNLNECRQAIIDHSTVPIGTVPIYSMIIGQRIEDLTYDVILKEIERQAEQVVPGHSTLGGKVGEIDAQRLLGEQIGRIVAQEMHALDQHVLGHDKIVTARQIKGRRVVGQAKRARIFRRQRRKQLRDHRELAQPAGRARTGARHRAGFPRIRRRACDGRDDPARR